MIDYTKREAEKKEEYPLSPQHDWVTEGQILIITHNL